MHLTRLTCFGITALIGSVHAVDVQAQAPTPLRVDPVLLGLPPAKPTEKASSPQAETRPV